MTAILTGMFSDASRRLSIWLVILVVATGFTAQGVRAAHVSIAAATALEESVPDVCDGCGCGEDCGTMTSCSISCVGYYAILPSAIHAERIETTAFPPATAFSPIDRRAAPDPFPPRRSLLI